MEFVQQPYIPGETIAALATPPGEGGIAIIRISGRDACAVASKIFSKNVEKLESHTAHFGAVRTPAGDKIDEALLIVMRAPRSFTGEDTVEIQCHGGRLVSQKVLQAALQAGARAARPGEFSFTAFMNGKMDLARAEAIQALIHAKNEQAMQAAQEQLDGALSSKVLDFQKRLTLMGAILEAWVDFPEEDLEFQSFEETIQTLQGIRDDISRLVATFHRGRMIHEGIELALIGSPNVGKSSIMNLLLGKERAIVSPIAGTTRDIVEDDLRLNGLHFRLVDTAGIRETDEIIEEEGIKRSRRASQKADIILFVLDASHPTFDEALLQEVPREKAILVWNKCDIQHVEKLPHLGFEHVVELSCKTGAGIDALYLLIDRVVWQKGASQKEEIVITSLRHKEALERSGEALDQVIQGLRTGISAEFVAFDVRQALHQLGTIIGTNVTEDVLTAIFSKFCIGK